MKAYIKKVINYHHVCIIKDYTVKIDCEKSTRRVCSILYFLNDSTCFFTGLEWNFG